MDVEMKKLMDEIMNKMHQISWWFMELEKKELEGVKISSEQIQENKAINTLFENVQKDYRDLQDLIVNSVKSKRKRYIENNSVKTEEHLQDEIIGELISYLENAYVKLRYVTYSIKGGRKVNVIHGIYSDTPYEGIINAENEVQHANLEYIRLRIQSLRNPEVFSFEDKAEIIQSEGIREFYNGYVFSMIEDFSQRIPAAKETIDEDDYDSIREKMISQKYTRHYLYLNKEYNGFLQRNDFGKFAIANHMLEDGMEATLLGMSEYEIQANKAANEEEFHRNFDRQILGIIHEVSIKGQDVERA